MIPVTKCPDDFVRDAQTLSTQGFPQLVQFIAQFAKMWGRGGALERRGLVPFAGAEAAAATQQSTALKPPHPAGLK